MKTVLLCWELGLGLGHLINLLPLAQGLSKNGHRVVLALRDLAHADRVFSGLGVSYFQAPMRHRRNEDLDGPPGSFAQILHNIGFGDAGELRIRVDAWRNIYAAVRPNLIVFDHSPTALLSAHGNSARRALLGTGFFCPLDTCPMPDLRSPSSSASEELVVAERHVLANCNEVLGSFGQPAMTRLSQLYYDIDEHFLVTFLELDHYSGRAEAKYWGAWPFVGGKKPEWPSGLAEKVYAYLRPFPALPGVLAALNELRCPTIVRCDGLNESFRKQFQSPTLRFEMEQVDLKQAARECDFAILNGNHGTTVAMLLEGKPILQLPVSLEQDYLSDAVVRLGAGLKAPSTRPDRPAVSQLMAMLNTDQYAAAAKRFSAKYADVSQEQRIDAVLQRAEELLA